MVAKAMNQDVVAFEATNGILNDNADLAQGFVGGFLVSGQLGFWVVLALARFFDRYFNQYFGQFFKRAKFGLKSTQNSVQQTKPSLGVIPL